MIPREILRKIRRIEIRTRKLVSDTLAGQYHSVFKGRGMSFDEVREYQPGDDVRSIDWNVTARMNQPFIKKYVEERELTVMLLVDLSGSGLFGSGERSKRELSAEIASLLAFSAIRNQDKVGLILFTGKVEKYIPPRKGRFHVLRVIREILFHEPEETGTDFQPPLQFLSRVIRQRSIVLLISDFLGQAEPRALPGTGPARDPLQALSLLRRAGRRHDLVAVLVSDPFESDLPAIGRIVLKDAETGRVVEVDTGDRNRLRSFSERRRRSREQQDRMLRSAGIDSIRLSTDQPYDQELARFFERRGGRRRR